MITHLLNSNESAVKFKANAAVPYTGIKLIAVYNACNSVKAADRRFMWSTIKQACDKAEACS